VQQAADTLASALRGAASTWKGPLATAIAYAIAAQIGFRMTFPPATTSVLWPPNAILTVAFLLARPRDWWMYLLATFPAHLLVELPIISPAVLVPLLFVTNCSEALIAVGIVRKFSDHPGRFDTIRRMGAFIIGAVLVAPVVSSFLDAGIASALTDQQYWSIWATRVPANALTALTLIPPAVMLISWLQRGIRQVSPRRVVEALMLAAVIAIVGVWVFGNHMYQFWPISALPAISLVFPLPLVLLAALRFGAGGASMSLSMIAAILIWMGTTGRGPFSTLPAADGVLAIQTFLILQALPLMCLAAIVEERRAAEADLRDRLKFERLLSHLSGEFVRRLTHEHSAHFEEWLGKCGEFFGADEVRLLHVDPGTGELSVLHAWTCQPAAAVEASRDWQLPSVLHALEHGSLDGVSDSLTVTPLRVGQQTIGALALVRNASHALGTEDRHRLQLLAEAFASVLVRQRDEEEKVRAELQAQHSRAELTHVSRQRSMGELTASLAHELNQPLTGILGNAQAARRMLSMPMPDVEELTHILDDIIADERRADETILQIRRWMRKDEFKAVALDLNAVILDVATLLRNDAVIRNLRLELRLSNASLMIEGDPVELRQLILNLLLNAMDAVAKKCPNERVVCIQSEALSDGVVHVSVEDSGEGVPQDVAERIFEPFYTTKPTGLGMGLSIAKSIVESHHGSIWLSRGAHRGARFEFSLPGGGSLR
jgi:signal transduction histidine kinase/integral membrane sensor domain MASE1